MNLMVQGKWEKIDCVYGGRGEGGTSTWTCVHIVDIVDNNNWGHSQQSNIYKLTVGVENMHPVFHVYLFM